ncbi:MAG TPA: hypothetical protein VHY91_21845 [Pirellulales bacterium]|jgi:hypothetical protein|nr:hypothetical protein [Pirellulales bacterium]
MRIVPKYRIAYWSAAWLTFLLLPKSLWGQQTPASQDDGFATAVATDGFATAIATDSFATAVATDEGAAQPTNPVSFLPNWKAFLSQVADGDSGNDPRKRFFVSYQQMLFTTSPMPGAGGLAGHAAQQTGSAASLPAALGNDVKPFSATALENLGTSAIGSLVPNLGSGSRLEIRRMDTDTTGWSVSILDLNNSGTNAQAPDGNRAARPK